ncbi:response regulator [Clostridium sp.]|uniref:response regulator transcription factor n=1 Tax=Clostridium sp. TaxID=1506 RepID=UPI0025B8D805|nr:response regulator [Clostridium sp.]
MYRILIVDDEPLELEALNIIINKKIKGACVVGEAYTGEEALNINKKLEPDMIIMDVVLPVISGLEVAELIKRENEEKKIVLISAYDTFELIQKALRIKVDDYLLKPVRPEKIIEIITKYIENKSKYSIDTCKNILLQNINEHNYKKSTYTMEKIIKYFENLSLEEARNYTRNLIETLLKQFEIPEFSLKINVDYKSILNIYSITSTIELECCLFNVLRELFNIVLDEKLCYTDDIKKALNYVENHFGENLTLKNLADYMNFSAPYLSKIFKKKLGINFNKYILLRRIEESKKILSEKSITINDLAFTVGFNEPNYFCTVFKKEEGMTPLEYKKIIVHP